MMLEKTIAVLPGDGIGPEVVREALKVLDAAAAKGGPALRYVEAPVAGAAIDRCGVPLPESTIEI
jgi:3-isopropylmalate dehydrogenase